MRLDKKMCQFEIILEQFEPMITVAIRKCRIYKNHEHYRQTARIALWKAWQKYDDLQGDFAPYAYTCIHGSILDELKKESRYEERYQPQEDVLLSLSTISAGQSETACLLKELLNTLPKQERQLLVDYYITGHSYEELTTKYHTTIAALKKRRSRILEKLRKNL